MSGETQVIIETLNFVLNFPGGLQAELAYEDRKEHYTVKELLSSAPEPMDTTVCRGHVHLLGSATTLLTQAFSILENQTIIEQTVDLNCKEWWTSQIQKVPFGELCGEEPTALTIEGFDQWWLYQFQLALNEQDNPEVITIGINSQTGEYLPEFNDQLRDYPLVHGRPTGDIELRSHLGIKESYYLACQAMEQLLVQRSLPLVASVIHNVDCVLESNQESSNAQRDYSPHYSITFISLSSLYLPIVAMERRLEIHWPGPRVVQL